MLCKSLSLPLLCLEKFSPDYSYETYNDGETTAYLGKLPFFSNFKGKITSPVFFALKHCPILAENGETPIHFVPKRDH